MIGHINSSLFLNRSEFIMANKDNKGRNLKPKESQMADGRYRYRYTDKHGKACAIYSWKLVPTDKIPQGKRDDVSLREKIRILEKDLDDGINTTSSKMSVNELIQSYLETKTRISISTKNNYIHMWEKNIKNTFLGIIQICNVKKSDILRYYAYLYKDKHFSVGTIQLYQNLLYPTFQLAVDDSIIRLNPCKNCMKEYVQGSMSSTKYPLSKEEQDILLDFVKEDTIYSPYYTLLTFMLSTGCRIGETLGITWNDINLEEKYINVDHQIIYKKKDGRIQFYSSLPKNKNSRIVPLQDNIVKILKKHRQESFFISKGSGFKIDQYSNFVFINREGKPYTPNTIVRAFHGIRNAYNKIEQEESYMEKREAILLPDFSPHTLRHTFCTRMAENGINVKVLQEIMGHSNIAVTMQVYNHVDFNRTKKEIEKLDDILEISV
jgi:integrase